MKVYVLQHERDLGDATDVKMIGVYGTPADAQAARDRLSMVDGFREYREGFSIDAYELGEDHWTEGFRTKPASRARAIKVRDHAVSSSRVRRLSMKA